MTKDWYSEDHLRILVLEELIKAIREKRSITLVGNQSKLSSEVEELCRFFYGLSPKMDKRSYKESKEWSRKLVEMDVLQQKILASSSNIYGQIFGQVNILELAEITSDAKNKKSHLLLAGLLDNNLFEFSKQEFWAIRGRIVKAMDLFSEELIFMDIHSPLNDSIYVVQEENSRAVVNKYLDNFIGKTHALIRDYAHFFTAFKKEVIQERKQKLDYINQMLYSYIAEYNQFRVLPTENEIELLKNDIEKWLNIDDFSKDYIMQIGLSESIFQSIHRANKYTQLFVEKKRKTINIRNYDNAELRQLEDRLEAFLKELNGSEILTDRMENNSISSWLKFQKLQEVHNVLTSTKSLLQQGNPYFQWKAFIEDCDMQMQHILEQLVKFPKMDWLPMVESWYLSETLEVLGFYRQSTMQDGIKKFCENHHDQFMDFQSVLETMSLAIDTDDKPSLQFITSEEHNRFYERIDASFFDNNILVVLPSSNIDHSVKLAAFKDFTSCIYFSERANTNFHENYIDRSNFIKSDLVSAELNDKLQWSKFLAHSLKNYVSDLKFLFTPTKNIITHSRSFILDDIIQILQDGNIKQIHINDHVEQNITEYFLNDSEKAYFIYDQSMFRFGGKEDVLKFGALIEALQTAGYHTIYMDNTRFDDIDYIEELKKNTAQIASYA